jgi:hypothetical protein
MFNDDGLTLDGKTAAEIAEALGCRLLSAPHDASGRFAL